jgi:hypothetical protein
MARPRMLFATIYHYAGRSDSLGIIDLLSKRLVSSILCAARFRAGLLRTAVLSLILVQDEYTSVFSSGVLRTAIATIRCRPFGNRPEIFSLNSYPLRFAGITPTVLLNGSFPHVLC